MRNPVPFHVRQFGVVLTATLLIAIAYSMLTPSAPGTVHAQSGLGGPIPHLTTLETQLFNTGETSFVHVWTPREGLGPVYLEKSCVACHSDPVTGGNSTQKITFVGKINSDGSFSQLTNEGGPELQPFGVQTKQCMLGGEVVPSDATIVASHETPQTFGSGLIDNVPDTSILANAIDKGMGIHGVANMIVDENGILRVGRFGYKSEFADLLQTTAYEMVSTIGITNPIFPNEDLPQGNPIPPGCATTREPNDDGTQMVNLYHYELYLAPNSPGKGNSNGQALFTSIGCALCHLPGYTTPANVSVLVDWNGRKITSKALSNQPVNLYSDLLLHDMGGVLGDAYEWSLATGTQFRTAPLWGLSTRIADGDGLLHDGRAKTVSAAITLHGGEASQVISNFKALSASDQNDLIAFVSSL